MPASSRETILVKTGDTVDAGPFGVHAVRNVGGGSNHHIECDLEELEVE